MEHRKTEKPNGNDGDQNIMTIRPHCIYVHSFENKENNQLDFGKFVFVFKRKLINEKYVFNLNRVPLKKPLDHRTSDKGKPLWNSRDKDNKNSD